MIRNRAECASLDKKPGPARGLRVALRHADIGITACSLDQPERAAPEDHTYARSKLAWLKLADGLPHYRRSRSEG